LRAIAEPIAANTLPREFEQVFQEHSEFVYRTAYRVLGNSEDAEDVLQSLFVRLLRREWTAEFARNPKAYLYRAAVNLSLNVIRSRQRSVLTGDMEVFESEPRSEPAKEHTGQEELLRKAIATLKPKAAEILLLRYVHGYSDAEIARLLGTSRGTIAVSLFRSKARLRKYLRTHSGEES
jgi:RNA polymerase sigma-70 factor (ECF subfamily)